MADPPVPPPIEPVLSAPQEPPAPAPPAPAPDQPALQELAAPQDHVGY